MCVRVHLYMSLFEARHVRLFIYAFVCHSFSPHLTYMCLCVCVCVCLCLFVSAAVAGTALQLPVGKDEFTLLFFLLRRLVVVAVFVGLPLFLSTALIYHWHCNLDKLFWCLKRVASNSVARSFNLLRLRRTRKKPPLITANVTILCALNLHKEIKKNC